MFVFSIINYAQHYIGKSRADMLKPTEVHLFSFCADIGGSTSIPCLRQYFAVKSGFTYFYANNNFQKQPPK